MEPFRFHLFVCTQQKPEGVPSCPASGSLALLEGLDRELQKRGLSPDVQLTTCGCMGLCDEGPVLVVYPEAVWYRRVQSSDVSEIVDAHLLHDKPVNRLVWNDAPAMRAMSIEHGEKFRAAMAAREKAGTSARPPGSNDPWVHAESLHSYRAGTRHLYGHRRRGQRGTNRDKDPR